MSLHNLIYLAGFLDGDGSVIAQLKPRADYKNGFQAVLTVQFTQRLNRKIYLEKFKDWLGIGNIRVRAGVCDLIIGETRSVYEFLKNVKPFVLLKRRQVDIVLSIIERLPEAKKNPSKFLEVAILIDKVANLNDSKNHVHTSETVKQYFIDSGTISNIIDGP